MHGKHVVCACCVVTRKKDQNNNTTVMPHYTDSKRPLFDSRETIDHVVANKKIRKGPPGDISDPTKEAEGT